MGTSEVEKPVKEESETEPQTDTKTEVSTISTPAEDELPALEGDEDGKDEITSLVTSGSSDDFVDVKAEGSVLAAKLSEICKINLEDAEKFLTKNDESLVQAMIDNNLLRELRSAVAVTTSQEDPSTSDDITTNQLEQEKQNKNKNKNKITNLMQILMQLNTQLQWIVLNRWDLKETMLSVIEEESRTD